MDHLARRNRLYNILAISCAVWFLISGWAWLYFMNLFISFPFAALGLFFWYKARKAGSNNALNRITLILFISGAVISVTVLLILLFTN
jgi:hypothetical protein